MASTAELSAAQAEAQNQGAQQRRGGDVEIDLSRLVLDSERQDATVAVDAARERGGVESEPAGGRLGAAGRNEVQNDDMDARVGERLRPGALAGDGRKLDVIARNLRKARRHHGENAEHRENHEQDEPALASALPPSVNSQAHGSAFLHGRRRRAVSGSAGRSAPGDRADPAAAAASSG